jgi:kumamolisin
VFGLDNRPVVRRRAIRHRGSPGVAADGAQGFTSDQLAKVYDFPSGVDGKGQAIGIIELGGGFRPADLAAYFKGLGLPTPTVIPVSVDGGANAPTTADSDDGEVVLDIEVAGAAAPGAKIVVYFAPNDRSGKGFLDAVTKAIHDTENNVSVISISWGGTESPKGDSFQVQFDQALQAAALLGVTVCVAAGDDGAADTGPIGWDGKAHVDFPAASPFALACGGTRLIAPAGAIQAESIWNQHSADTSPDAGQQGSFGSGGGGVSGAFPLPAYQAKAGVPGSLNPKGFKGRGVPDVTGDGDPDSGYKILVDGTSAQFGGTSAVAPLWAALIARINQKLNGRVGFIHPQIYSLPANSGAFHDITAGNNRVTFKKFHNVGYDAKAGWDACSGLGSPNGAVLASLLTASKPAPTVKPKPMKKRKE